MGGAASVYRVPTSMRDRTTFAFCKRNRALLATRSIRRPGINQPGLDTSCELRETGTIASPVLTLFNAEEDWIVVLGTRIA